MKLSIKNCAKINSANIIIDGITVIAGENNTGKSTVGKILFSVFNAMNDIDIKITEERKREIYNVCRVNIRGFVMSNEMNAKSFRTSDILARRISEKIFSLADEDIISDKIADIIKTCAEDIHMDINYSDAFEEFDALVGTIANAVINIYNIPEMVISREVLTRYFQDVFSGQINSLFDDNPKANISVDIKGKKVELQFKNDMCSNFDSQVAILHKAIYIDNPFIIDALNSYAELNMMDKALRRWINEETDKDVMDGIIESVIAKEKLEKIDELLEKIVDGKILKTKNDDYFLSDDVFRKPISLKNLSTGLKSFVLIKMLIEKGILKNKDVIILDEPEIHLHPEWQILYAELIVLLQKFFDLTIVVTTHSPYFVDALNLFSVKHEIDSKVNYYLSLMKNDGAEMELVTDNIEKIFKEMASPIQVLETLRYELNNK